MKVHLMAQDADFDPEAPEPDFADDLVQDLQLDYLWDAMAGGDSYLRHVARAATLQSLTDPAAIERRRAALADALANADTLARLYQLTVDALTVERGIFMMPVKGRPESVLYRAVRVLTALADSLDGLRAISTQAAPTFESAAFSEFFRSVAQELDDGYMASLRHRLHELAFPDGMVMSAGIGRGGAVAGPTLRRGSEHGHHLFSRSPLKRPFYSFTVPERDEAGFNALADLKDCALLDVANAAAQAVEHLMAFFRILRAEIGFLIGCTRLVQQLRALGAPVCFPDPSTRATTQARGLYDPCLALRMNAAPVGNDVDLGDLPLLVITGANRGGKSTMLRALGAAQLMMQAGMVAPAEAFSAHPVGRVLTHWAREEDNSLERGKLDEELERMHRIATLVRRGDLLLSNESFASTNEAEGSQLLLEVVETLVDAGVQVRAVTHLHDFAQQLFTRPETVATFLRAPRSASRTRTYQLEPGAPLSTSFGLDLYDNVLGTAYADAG